MDTKKLNDALNQVLYNFSTESRMLFPEGSSNSVDSSDLSELSKQTFYALSEFKREIISFLQEN